MKKAIPIVPQPRPAAPKTIQAVPLGPDPKIVGGRPDDRNPPKPPKP